jgi:hypothetical protein
MEVISVKGFVRKVTPKKSRGHTIEVVIDTAYSMETLGELASCMMHDDEAVDIEIRYEPTPLFVEDDEQSELDYEGE